MAEAIPLGVFGRLDAWPAPLLYLWSRRPGEEEREMKNKKKTDESALARDVRRARGFARAIRRGKVKVPAPEPLTPEEWGSW